MHRKPVNGLNLEMLTDLNIALEKVESEKSCRGLVLTSVCSMFPGKSANHPFTRSALNHFTSEKRILHVFNKNY